MAHSIPDPHRKKAQYSQRIKYDRHKLYKSPLWWNSNPSKPGLSQRFLKLNPRCKVCSEHGALGLASEVDHIKPHNGNEELFFNEENLQSLCKACHTEKTRREQNDNGNK